MYKWPQGKIVRMIVLVVAVLVAIDLGWGAYGEFSAGLMGEGEAIVWSRVIKLSLFVIVGLGVLIYGLSSALFSERNASFLIEVEQEAAKVTLPSRQELVRSTIIIAIGTVIMSVVLLLVDLINGKILDLIHSLGGS